MVKFKDFLYVLHLRYCSLYTEKQNELPYGNLEERQDQDRFKRDCIHTQVELRLKTPQHPLRICSAPYQHLYCPAAYVVGEENTVKLQGRCKGGPRKTRTICCWLGSMAYNKVLLHYIQLSLHLDRLFM